jgi:hypothetical protein
MKQILGLLLLFLAARGCLADEASHLKLAREFDALSGASSRGALVSAFLPQLVRLDPSLEPHKDALQQALTEILESEEYQLGKARIYMRLYSEAELALLLDMVRSPAYQLLQARRIEMTTMLAEHGAAQVRDRLPTLLERLGVK